MRLAPWFLALCSIVLAGPAAAQEYRTMPVVAESIGNSAIVGGTVIPYKEVTLSAQIPGQVMFIAGSEGDKFDRGAVLISIDDDDLQAQRRAALADIYNAEAALRNAQVQYSRELWSPRSNSPGTLPGMGMPSLFDQFFTRNFSNMMGRSNTGFERHADLYAQGSGISQARSRLLAARAQVEILDAKLRDARLLAPFDGVIVDKVVETGDTVQPGQPLIKFAFTQYLRIQVEVPARLVPGLKKGMFLPARLDVGGAPVQARVAQIYPMADASRHTVTVKMDLPKGTPGSPGMYAEVRIPDLSAPQRQLAVVPEAALVWRGSLPSVFVMLPDGRPSLRVLRLGSGIGPGRVSVLAGVKPGELVIINPPPGLASGRGVN